MSTTAIEWTRWPGTVGAVWNIVTGCNKVDRGCKFCYAEVMHRRLMFMQPAKYSQPFLNGAVMHPALLNQPATWKKPRTVFVNSMSDLFHAHVTFEFLESAFNVMDRYDRNTYLILTKRPERALEFWFWMRRKRPGWKPGPHVCLGTSANDQESGDIRIPLLLLIDIDTRFLSYEPATGPLDLRRLGSSMIPIDALNGFKYMPGFKGILDREYPKLGWVICGGESGNKATPMHPDWARSVRDHCKEAKVPFFFKQWGRWEPVTYNVQEQVITTAGDHSTEFLFGAPYRPQNMRKARRKDGHLLDGVEHRQLPIKTQIVAT